MGQFDICAHICVYLCMHISVGVKHTCLPPACVSPESRLLAVLGPSHLNRCRGHDSDLATEL